MLNAMYELSDCKPSSEDMYFSGSPMDLRNGHLMPEYCERTTYVNMAVAIQPIKVPCNLFQGTEGANDGLWKGAACISDQWQEIKAKKDIAKTVESNAKALIEAVTGNKSVKLQISLHTSHP